mmetsp:Transcript_12983/g.38646  ORF Transcript_12983/g.38646 Transcript_12983/m.38646 type:complete len:429 (-) Transcript_12983:77-1363(-)
MEPAALEEGLQSATHNRPRTDTEETAAVEGPQYSDSDDEGSTRSDSDASGLDFDDAFSGAAAAANLSRQLVKRGAISSAGVAAAFARVDRQAFVPSGYEDAAWDDAPLRAWDDEDGCVVHLSAPSIYAQALEALDLESPEPSHGGALSFLNIGSGSGYFSALAATLLGRRAVHRCVELSAPLALRSARALERLATQKGFGSVPEAEHVLVERCSAFDLDLDGSMRFDRVYVGARARAEDVERFGRLLKPGGVLVGPFEERGAPEQPFYGAPQSLLRATRSGEGFDVVELIPVQFAPLVRGDGGDSDGEDTPEEAEAAPKPKAPPVRLLGPRWAADAPLLFGVEFHLAVQVLRRATAGASPGLARLPWHVVEAEILGYLTHDCVRAAPAAAPPAPTPPESPAESPKSPSRSLRLARTLSRVADAIRARL